MGKKNRIKAMANTGRQFNTNQKPQQFGYDGNGVVRRIGGSTDPKKNLNNFISPVQLQRLRHDVKMWRESIQEAELAWYPFRVKMQKLFIDTILNGHVWACMERRRDLTLLREYRFVNTAGEETDDLKDLKKMFDREWFDLYRAYTLDAKFFGYSLISLGDCIEYNFPGLELIRRENISPDRRNVGEFVYSVSGQQFDEEPFRTWHVFTKTPSENGITSCGYGLLYKVALLEIFLRNTLGYNGDFVELFAMPYRVGKTQKTDETERAEMAETLSAMGSAGWALIDEMDSIEIVESKSGGTGYVAYESLEKRCEARISKLILGHADAMDSTPGKLGSGQDGEESPVDKAKKEKQIKDGKDSERNINEELLPRLIELGWPIPDGTRFEYKNDGEEIQAREREDKNNKAVADIAQVMKNAGLKMTAEYFTERTGIPCEEIEEPDPMQPGGNDPAEKARIKKINNKLKDLYSAIQ